MKNLPILLLLCALLLARPAVTHASSAGYVEGTVTYSGRPVPNATVSAAGATTTTSSEGAFRFGPIQVSGEYLLTDVTVRARGYGTWRLSDARVLPNDTLRITAELSKRQVSLSQPAPAHTANLALSPRYGALSITSSQSTPPSSIRVYVTGSTSCDPNAKGTVRTVGFNDYVKHVLPSEWFASWNEDSLRAGAVAAKNYAWYWVSRGGKWPSLGADVMDSTCDQVYNPAVSYASTDEAVDHTWNWRVTEDDQLKMTAYRGGTRSSTSRCEQADDTGTDVMSQWGSECYAEQQGRSWYWIVAHYYPNAVLTPTTGSDLRVDSGPSLSPSTVTWGAPFSVSFTVHNYGTQPLGLNELYVELRGPNGENADLGGDGDSDAIQPGESRTVSLSTSAVARQAPGVYGYYTLTPTYRDAMGRIGPALKTRSGLSYAVRKLNVVAPGYSASTVSGSGAAPSYYEQTQTTATIQIRNTGTVTWYRSPTSSHNAMYLGTSPYNSRSRFYVSGYWLSPTRIPMVEPSVPPGGTANFRVRLGGSVPPGSYTQSFRLVSEGDAPGGYDGTFGPIVTIKPVVLADTTAPSAWVHAPQYSTESGAGLTFPVTWGGSDGQSGMAYYQVQYWSNGAWRNWRTATTSRSAYFGSGGYPMRLQPGRVYTLRMRSVDRAGNASSWRRSYCAVPYDDASLSYSRSWGAVSGSHYGHFLATLHFSPYSGRSVSLRFYGRQVAWVGTRGPDKGKAALIVDGVRVATVDLYSSTYTNRVVVYSRSLGNRNSYHTVQIRVLGTRNTASKGSRVDVDGVGVIR